MRSLLASWFVLCAACSSHSSSNVDGRDDQGPLTTAIIDVASRAFTDPHSGSAYTLGTASAGFVTRTEVACTDEAVGACHLYTCPRQFPPSVNHSAGTITITGAARPITLTPMPDSTYETYQSNALFSGGEHLDVSTSGADIAAFTGSVTAPGRLTLTMPAPTAPGSDTPMVVDRTQPFHVTWTGVTEGTVSLRFSGPTGATLDCRVPANDHAAEIPASALAVVPAGLGRFDASSETLQPVDAGAWRIDLQASFDAVWSDMNVVANVPTMYQ